VALWIRANGFPEVGGEPVELRLGAVVRLRLRTRGRGGGRHRLNRDPLEACSPVHCARILVDAALSPPAPVTSQCG
jgi:hypothetical protein